MIDYWFWIYDLPNWRFGVLTVFGILRIRNRGAGRYPKMGALAPSCLTFSYNDIVGCYFGAITVLMASRSPCSWSTSARFLGSRSKDGSGNQPL